MDKRVHLPFEVVTRLFTSLGQALHEYSNTKQSQEAEYRTLSDVLRARANDEKVDPEALDLAREQIEAQRKLLGRTAPLERLGPLLEGSSGFAGMGPTTAKALEDLRKTHSDI